MKRIGLIGYPLEHSFSQRYFTEKFDRESIGGIRYDNYPIASIAAFPKLLDRQPELIGLNVTIPYKTAVIPYLDALDEHARRIGAVNTIRIESGRTVGYNTDWLGFKNSLRKEIGEAVMPALILGSGGASKGVAYALHQMNFNFDIVSRSPDPGQIDYKAVEERGLEAYQLLVNTTPLGTFPHTEAMPPLPFEQLNANHLLFDLVYNPPITAFMQQAHAARARAINGYDMLVFQAEAAWKIWNE